MIVYLQHKDEKPRRVEIKDPEKYAQYQKAGVVWIGGKEYKIIEDDIKPLEVMWKQDVPKAKETSWDIMRKRTNFYKKFKRWPTDEEINSQSS